MKDKHTHGRPQVIELDQCGMDALDKSIRIWKKRITGEIIQFGENACPLCSIFSTRKIDDCTACPIAEWTGESACRDTPFYLWREEHVSVERNRYALEMYELLQEVRRHCVLKGEPALAVELREGIQNIIIEQFERWGRDIEPDKLIVWMESGDPRFEKVMRLFEDSRSKQMIVQFQDYSCQPLDRCRLATPEEVQQHEEKEKAARRKVEGWGVGIEEDKWIVWKDNFSEEILMQVASVYGDRVSLKKGPYSTVMLDYCRLATPKEMYRSGAKVRHKANNAGLNLTGIIRDCRDVAFRDCVSICGLGTQYFLVDECTLLEAGPREKESK